MLPIRLDNAVKTYANGHTALRGLNLELRSREVVGLLGPNGAGKTTAIKLLATVLKPSSGQLLVGPEERDLWAGDEGTVMRYKRSIGWMPEHAALYDRLTASEFLAFVGQLMRFEAGKLGPRIVEVLESVGLPAASKQCLGTYSNGMQRKVTLAAALLGDPAVLLLDEPTASLDPQGARQVKDLVSQWRSQGKAILLSTHILEIAEQLCDRVNIVQDGRTLFAGSADELRRTVAGASSRQSLEDLFLMLTGQQ